MARPRAVVAAWLALLALAVPFAMRQSTRLSAGGYAIPGSQSSRVEATLKREFPEVNRPTLTILLWPRSGATASNLTAAIMRVERQVRGVSDVTVPRQSRELAAFASGLVEPIIIPLQVHTSEDHTQEVAEVLRQRLGLNAPTSHSAVEVHLLGEGALRAGLAASSKRQLASAEAIGFPVVLVVLLLIFGSVAAAALPIALGVATVILTGAIIYFLSLAVSLSIYITNTASLLGIGVAVDYSLIILARVRQELAAGHNLGDAQRIALRTSGSAVIFSGVTVIASLAGLSAIPNSTLRSMALGAILAVAVSVVASVTLLPALIAMFGARRLSVNHLTAATLPRRSGEPRDDIWATFTKAVMRHPVLAVIIVGGTLLVLCVPTLHMRTSTGAVQQLSPKDQTRVGFAEAASLVGPGALGPAYVTVHVPNSASPAQRAGWVNDARLRAEHLPDVRDVSKSTLSSDGRYGVFTVVPAVDPESATATNLVQNLRQSLSTVLGGTGATVAVGGTSAIQLDEQRGIATGMWRIIVVVLLLAFVVLTVVLRSVILPFKAIVMNLLSVGAAYGVLVVVFQWGWFDSILGYHALGHLNTLTPPLILAIVFGLSMDYEVFLLSRIKERWLATGDSRGAVAEGLAASAKTISSAAFILVCVFAVFIGTGMPTVKELGLGAAVAVGIDATLIRLILVPATMQLLGDWSWWLPRPLDRWRMPRATSEPVALDAGTGPS